MDKYSLGEDELERYRNIAYNMHQRVASTEYNDQC